MTFQQMLLRLQQTLQLTQKELGELIGCSSRTIIRYYHGGGTLLPGTYEKLAVAVYPRDRAFAAYLAQFAGRTLVDLGLEKPAPAAPPGGALRATASSRHLVDSIVCAAAEAMQTTPQAMRPALVAAFERAIALGMAAGEVLQGMAVEVPKAGKARAPSAQP